MIINSLKIIYKYYKHYNKKTTVVSRLVKQLTTFILILFLFGYIFYHITNFHNITAPLKYSNYDAQILNVSLNQAHKIQNYDFVDKFVIYTNIRGTRLTNKNLVIGTDLTILNSDNLKDIDYTPFCPELIINRDNSLLKNKNVNPIILRYSDAKQLNVKIRDKLVAQMSGLNIEYTVAGIYEDAVVSQLPFKSFVLLNDSLKEWIFNIEKRRNPNAKEPSFVGNSGYIKFNNKIKGTELINSFYSDVNLFSKYGENWLEKATPAELEYNKGVYVYREKDYEIRLNNIADGYIKVIALVAFGFLTLIIFIIWQQNKLISITMQSISILVASGCRKIGFFIYFMITTFMKQLICFLLTIPIIKYPFMSYLSSNDFHWYLPWYLITENLPVILSAILIASLTVSLALYIKLRRKLVLFSGEE